MVSNAQGKQEAELIFEEEIFMTKAFSVFIITSMFCLLRRHYSILLDFQTQTIVITNKH